MSRRKKETIIQNEINPTTKFENTDQYANNTQENIYNNKNIKHPEPKIVVLGIGGAGCNAVNNMLHAKVGDGKVTFVVCNTDQQALSTCSERALHIQVGPKTTKGLGAGADPKKGEEATKESIEDIVSTFHDAHMLFITAGGGGGTGGGGAPEIAKAARAKGILTIGFMTKPFMFEGRARELAAQQSIEKLQAHVDCLIVVQNQNLLATHSASIPFLQSFAKVDDVLRHGIAGIVNIIQRRGIINLDFQDVLKVMKDRMSRVVFGVGLASGEDAGSKAAAIALSNPLLELDQDTLRKVDTALVNITGGSKLSLETIQSATEYLRSQINTTEDTLIVGMAINPEMKDDEVEVCIFASCPKENQTHQDLNPALHPDLHLILNNANQLNSQTLIDDLKTDYDSIDKHNKINEQYIGKPHLNLQEEGDRYNFSKDSLQTSSDKKAKDSFQTSSDKKAKFSIFDKFLTKRKNWF